MIGIDNFDLCEKCEKTKYLNYPRMKFNTHQAYLSYLKSLKDLYTNEEEEKGIETSIIDYESNLTIEFFLSSIFLVLEPEEESSRPLIKKVERIEDYGATFVDSMPRTDYTIDHTQENICITFHIKNTGNQEWPSAYMVHLLSCDNEKINSMDFSKIVRFDPVVDQTVKPGSTCKIDVVLTNPRMVGTFKYKFAMHTLNYKTFGEPYEFSLIVKGSCAFGGGNSSKSIWVQPQKHRYGWKPWKKFGWRPKKKGIFKKIKQSMGFYNCQNSQY